jgi:hypothetical protein
LPHSTDEETDVEKLAHEVDFHPTYKADFGKLAREVDLGLARDNALVPDQKEHNDDVLALRKSVSGASYGKALSATQSHLWSHDHAACRQRRAPRFQVCAKTRKQLRIDNKAGFW